MKRIFGFLLIILIINSASLVASPTATKNSNKAILESASSIGSEMLKISYNGSLEVLKGIETIKEDKIFRQANETLKDYKERVSNLKK